VEGWPPFNRVIGFEPESPTLLDDVFAEQNNPA